MWYTMGISAGKLYLSLFKKLTVSGTQNVPEAGPVILASNHKSNLDPFCMGAVLKRQIHFLAKDELFHNPVLGWLMRKWGTVQVKRGESDRAAISAAMDILKQERVLGVFVEGTRRKDIEGVGNLKAGAAMLSQHAQAPIVPVAIKWTGKNVHICFGKPISASTMAPIGEGETSSRKAVYSRINEAITNALDTMLTD